MTEGGRGVDSLRPSIYCGISASNRPYPGIGWRSPKRN
jgi:hypothetical protein